MKFEFQNTELKSFFALTNDLKKEELNFPAGADMVKILWNQNRQPTKLYVDDQAIYFMPDQILTATFFHHLSLERSDLPITAFLFNREFYCLADHDSEVSCNGILFFGTQDLPIITIPTDKLQKFKLLFDVFVDEFKTPDKIQGDMLQMLLKRLIIICTRLAKEQLILKKTDSSQMDIIRRFNFLVDVHFRTKRKVSDYADLLNKSPKTISNLFLLHNQKTPQQIIHDRLALEAKRMMLFSEKNSKEIAIDLGFNESAHFSKFFKKMVGLSPTEYKEKTLS